jgi:hypothetical protein
MDDGSTAILTEAAAMSSSALSSSDAGVGISTPTDAAVDTNVDSTTDVATETGDASVEGSDKSQESDTNPDGSLKEFSLEKNGKVDFKALGKAIQSFKDASPENAIAAKQIHGALRRLEAFGQEFGGGINEAREVKSFLRELVGAEGNAPVTLQQAKEAYTNQKGIISSVEESDQLLYAGDGKLIDNIYEQMKNDGKQESFGKLADPFLNKLRQTDAAGYYKTLLSGHLQNALAEAEVDLVIMDLARALDSGDTKTASGLAKNLLGWVKQLAQKQAEIAKEPELKAQQDWQNEKAEFQKKQQTEFQQSIGKEAASASNKALAAHLGPYLRSAFFKGFSQTNLKPLAAQIQNNLWSELSADKDYQKQMKAFWGAKQPNKLAILQYHNQAVSRLAERIVRDTVNTMYPTHAKNGSAAGRVAATEAKRQAEAKSVAAQKAESAGGKLPTPIYVSEKPKNILRELDKNSLLEISGRAWVPDGKGGRKFITWRRP